MTERLADVLLGTFLSIPLKRFGYQILGAEADCKRQGENNSSEKYAESKFNNSGRNSQVLQGHRHSQHDD